MTSVMKILFACACVAALARAQYDFAGNYNGFGNSFLSGGAFNMLSGAAASRDARGNTGPVVFPPSPPGDPSQTSGVVVGASGYGFVPPNTQGAALPRFFYQGFYFR